MRIGIDLGGTKTEIICLNKSNGKELYRKRIPTQRGDYDVTVRDIAALVTGAEKELKQTGTVGIGIPGTISPDTGFVKNANSTWINGHPVDNDIAAALERPVRVENDANCFAVSESTDGAAEGRGVVFGVIVGTGCGGGLAINGSAHRGLNSIGGEWGHNPLPYPRVHLQDKNAHYDHFEAHPEAKDMLDLYFCDDAGLSEYPGPLCYCGRRGCLETWISGTGFKNDYVRVTGEALSTHDIIDEARAGKEKPVAALGRYTDRLARSLAQIINIIDPDIIVMGGGMSNVQALYRDVPKLWEKYIFSDSVKTQLVPALHGDSSGVRGAAWLWSREEGEGTSASA